MASSPREGFIEELKAMKERMEELFVRTCNPGADDASQNSGEWTPSADIVDTGDALVYTLDLPGVMDSDLEVECREERLWISGSRKEILPTGDAIRIERPRGAFSRVFKFPSPIDEKGIQAEFKKGVLRISVPKSNPEKRAQRIFVREAD